MLKYIVATVAVAFIFSGVSSVVAQPSNADKIKKAVEKIGVHDGITVVRSDDQWFYGTVEQVDNASFTIYEIEQKQRINFGFDQVKQVFKGYGAGGFGRRDIHGHRIPPRRHKMGLIMAGGVLAFVVIIALIAAKD